MTHRLNDMLIELKHGRACCPRTHWTGRPRDRCPSAVIWISADSSPRGGWGVIRRALIPRLITASARERVAGPLCGLQAGASSGKDEDRLLQGCKPARQLREPACSCGT